MPHEPCYQSNNTRPSADKVMKGKPNTTIQRIWFVVLSAKTSWYCFHLFADRYLANPFVGQIMPLNSLSPGRFEWNFRQVILKQNSVFDAWAISCEIVLRLIWMDSACIISTMVQVMAWCRHATSYYLTQSWPRPLSPYGDSNGQRLRQQTLISYDWNICPQNQFHPQYTHFM